MGMRRQLSRGGHTLGRDPAPQTLTTPWSFRHVVDNGPSMKLEREMAVKRMGPHTLTCSETIRTS